MTASSDIVDCVSSVATQQQVYHRVLLTFSYPGSVQTLPCTSATALSLVLATLVDDGAQWANVDGLVPAELMPLLGAPSSADAADFVVSEGWQTPPTQFQPRVGSLHHPHNGATLILQCTLLGEGPLTMRITGPGVRVESNCNVTGLDPTWLRAREGWVSRFPLGVDIILCDAQRVVGLPRTSVITFDCDR